MTSKRFLAAALLLLPAAFVACGDDDDGGGDATTTVSPDANGSASVTAATPTEPRALATPTPVSDGSPLVSIVAGGEQLAPTAADFAAWPQTSVTADGTEYTGVTLNAVAEATGATGAFFEIEGIRADGLRYAIARHPLADVGETSVLVVTSTGQVNFVSSSLDPAQWITAVSAISFV